MNARESHRYSSSCHFLWWNPQRFTPFSAYSGWLCRLRSANHVFRPTASPALLHLPAHCAASAHAAGWACSELCHIFQGWLMQHCVGKYQKTKKSFVTVVGFSWGPRKLDHLGQWSFPCFVMPKLYFSPFSQLLLLSDRTFFSYENVVPVESLDHQWGLQKGWFLCSCVCHCASFCEDFQTILHSIT